MCMPWRFSLLGVALAAFALAGSALSLPALERSFAPGSGRGSCLTTRQAHLRGCVGINAFRARGAGLSPDGRFLYTFGGDDAGSTIRVLSRDQRTGLVTPVPGRHGSIWANTPTALALSPDGRDLFVTAYAGRSHQFAAFRLDPRTGTP